MGNNNWCHYLGYLFLFYGQGCDRKPRSNKRVKTLTSLCKVLQGEKANIEKQSEL